MTATTSTSRQYTAGKVSKPGHGGSPGNISRVEPVSLYGVWRQNVYRPCHLRQPLRNWDLVRFLISTSVWRDSSEQGRAEPAGLTDQNHRKMDLVQFLSSVSMGGPTGHQKLYRKRHRDVRVPRSVRRSRPGRPRSSCPCREPQVLARRLGVFEPQPPSVEVLSDGTFDRHAAVGVERVSRATEERLCQTTFGGERHVLPGVVTISPSSRRRRTTRRPAVRAG